MAVASNVGEKQQETNIQLWHKIQNVIILNYNAYMIQASRTSLDI